MRVTKIPRRKWLVWALGSVAFVAVAAGMLYEWEIRTGCFSYTNYERIQVAMSRDQVTELLGSPGTETKTIPGYPTYVHQLGAPEGWTGVVWGDTFVHWQSGNCEIYVGFTDGRVTSKHYWEPSF